MRYFGTRALPTSPVMPDTTLQLLLTAATAQAFDYPAGTDMVRITAGSTLAGAASLTFNPSSTSAVVPSTGGVISSTAGGQNIIIPLGEARVYTRPRTSTGFSLVSVSSMSVGVEFWSRAGATG